MIRKLIAIPGRLLDMDDLGGLVVTGFAVLLVVFIIWLHPWNWNIDRGPSQTGSCHYQYEFAYDDGRYHPILHCDPVPTPTADRR